MVLVSRHFYTGAFYNSWGYIHYSKMLLVRPVFHYLESAVNEKKL